MTSHTWGPLRADPGTLIRGLHRTCEATPAEHEHDKGYKARAEHKATLARARRK